MFGYIRFILALLVVLSHLDIRFYGLNQGVIAVVIFYILAGFVVSYIYNNIYNRDYRLFIIDRVKRIFPLYLFIIFLTVIFLLTTNYGNPHFNLINILSNLTIIPLNFYMWIDSTILTNPKWCLIPPAWSLGTELQAYIILPFTIIYPKLKYILALISFLIYTVANLNIIHPDYYGYRLIVGVVFIFILGSSLQQLLVSKKRVNIYFISTIWFSTLFLMVSIIYLDLPIKAYLKETTIGILIGTPLIYLLSNSKKRLPLNSILGKLSYSLFLSHFLAIWIVKKYSFFYNYLLSVVTLALTIALIGIYMENIFKKKCRKNVD